MKINIETAICAINPEASFSYKGKIKIDDWSTDEYESIVWSNGTIPIAKADIEAKVAEMQTAEDAAIAQKATDKTNAKAKLIAGEALTEAEAATIVI